MKSIRIVSTVGEKLRKIDTDATTWGELQEQLGDYPLSAMKALIGETQNTLEQNDAVLPLNDFSLFLVNKTTKSGLN